MGIRNLAYCVLNTPELSTPSNTFHVRTWKRLDILGRLSGSQHADASVTDTTVPENTDDVPTKTDFSPSRMATAALSITEELLSHEPTTILIERQRFRSGGGSAIQEWTVRVNMLESMLWACLETTRRSRIMPADQPFPTTYEVSPARVAAFWTAERANLSSSSPESVHRDESLSPELPIRAKRALKAKTGKNDKIAVIESWLVEDPPGVTLEFSPEAQLQADVFMGVTTSRLRKRDDLADCLLQGVSWYRWEQNRRNILTERLLPESDVNRR